MRALLDYRGTRGTTRHCVVALGNFLQECTTIGTALLLSSPRDQYGSRSHALLLLLDDLPEVVIPDGFASGYHGEGPAGLRTALCLLYSRRWDIEEADLNSNLFERLCTAEATESELDQVLKLRRRPISEVLLYLPREDLDTNVMMRAWQELPVNLPLSLIEQRLFDIAIRFWEDPDGSLHRAYRRLEDLVRERSGLNSSNDHGAKLFSRAFGTDTSPLVWLMNDEPTNCYAPLFTASFTGFRNKRAHRDPDIENERALAAEFMQLNMLYRLEAELIPRPSPSANITL